MQWMDARQSVPLIQQLRAKADDYRSAEVARAQRLLANGEDPSKVLEILAYALTNKLLHHPLKSLKECSGEKRASVSGVVQEMYHLDEPHHKAPR